MADIKISLNMDEKLRKDLQDVLTETVKNIPSSLGNAVRSGVKEHKVPVKELVQNISEAREKALLAMLPEELRPGRKNTLEVKEVNDEQ